MKKTALIVSLLFAVSFLQAQPLKLAHIFSDHMVLQQQTEAPVWGWGVPGKTVTVEGSWGASARTKVADDGSWRVALPTAAGSTPEASGSRVPVCPTFLVPQARLTAPSALKDDIPSGLSIIRIPVIRFTYLYKKL